MVSNGHADRFHVDTLDLYHARSRRAYVKEAADELGASEDELRRDLGRVLLRLEQLQCELSEQTGQREQVELTEEERREALELLTDKNLFDRILDDFETCGIVGEQTGKLVGYLAATSRLLDKPLGLVIQSSSAAGKTSLLDAILAMMPPEHQFSCSAMTGQSLYYAGNLDLRHKILSVAEEEGVRDASYALKLLQSDGKLSIVTTGRETTSGKTAAERHEVQGPVAVLLTTTASDVDPELMNRCFVLSVDEDAQQTAAIQTRQRNLETVEALLARAEIERIRTLHQNAQRLLQPLAVVNPFADQLTFTDQMVRHRRDHAKYLALIRVVTLLHQHQRERKNQTIGEETITYIEVTKRDIELANAIADQMLGSSLNELPQQTQKLLRDLTGYVRDQSEMLDVHTGEIRFTRRQIREQLGWGATALRVHLDRLCAWEYVVAHGGGRGRLIRYELLQENSGDTDHRTVCGLADPNKLTVPTNLAG
jgi:hypothetical protein